MIVLMLRLVAADVRVCHLPNVTTLHDAPKALQEGQGTEGHAAQTGPRETSHAGTVLTLSEAADYLRVAE